MHAAQFPTIKNWLKRISLSLAITSLTAGQALAQEMNNTSMAAAVAAAQARGINIAYSNQAGQ